ncbi:jg2609, partial [Pararge aegeria aegeria]
YLVEQGAMSSTSYPYVEREEACRYDAEKVAVNVTGCLEIQGTEDDIAEQLATIGPLSIGNPF